MPTSAALSPDVEMKIVDHVFKAVEKHKEFPIFMTDGFPQDIRISLGHFREINDNPRTTKTVHVILMEEVLEMEEAFIDGKLDQAEDEAYDAIAVLLRTIKMIRDKREGGAK